MNIAQVVDAAKNPDALARPMPMWLWNGRLDYDRLDAQIEEMAEKGVKAFFILPLPSEFQPSDFPAGLEVEYLSEEYLRAVRFAVMAAAKRGMKVWLYDEGGWPSGTNLGRVVGKRPDLRGKVAHYNEQGQVEILERGYPVDLLDPETARTFIRQVHERYKAVVGEYFGKTIVGFFTDEPRYGGRVGGAEIPWTPALPEVFKKKKGYDIALGLSILFGLKASRSLPPNKRAQVLCDFHHVVSQLWRDSYFRVLQEWCAANNLLLTGHVCHEEDLHGHLTNGGDFFKAMECLDWPAVDVVSRQIFPGVSSDYPKFASSAAHVRGKNRALSESFAGYGWDLTFAQMKWITDFQYVRGVNGIAPVGLYSDAAGPRKLGTMSDLFFTNPLWRHFRPYAEYVGRLTALLSLGKPVVEVGVYYPIKSFWVGDISGDAKTVEDRFAALGRSLLQRQIDFDYLDDDAICRATIEKGGLLAVGDCRYRAILFPAVSIVPIETLRQLRAFAEAGGAVVFLYGEPQLTCRAASQSELPEILKAMASFIVSDGSDSDIVIGTLPWTIKLGIANHEIRATRRTTGQTEIFLVTNESVSQEHALRMRMPVEGPIYLFDPEIGAVTQATVDGKLVRHTLPPAGSAVLLVGAGEVKAQSAFSPAATPTRSLAMEGPWTLTVAAEWVYRDGEIIPLESAEQDEDGDIKDALSLWGEQPGENHAKGGKVVASSVRVEKLADWNAIYFPTFCGTVEYLIACEIDEKPGRAVLDLGVVGVVAAVIVNAQAVGERLWPPYSLDISDAMVSGLNTFRIVVTSTLHRLMSDPTVIADIEERGWFNTYAQQVAGFKGDPAPAGLLGPVKLHLWV